jgi:hypothetical protein
VGPVRDILLPHLRDQQLGIDLFVIAQFSVRRLVYCRGCALLLSPNGDDDPGDDEIQDLIAGHDEPEAERSQEILDRLSHPGGYDRGEEKDPGFSGGPGLELGRPRRF